MISKIDALVKALADTGLEVPTPSAAKPDVIPFEKFLDAAVQHLNELSGQELSASAAVQDYVKGKSSLEDAVFAMNELTTSVQLANQVLSTAVSTFREIEQMQI